MASERQHLQNPYRSNISYIYIYVAVEREVFSEGQRTTSTDRTNYYERVPSNYLEQVLWMESDRMENLLPVLTQAKLDNQRDVVKNERRQNYEDRPYGIVAKHMAEAIHPHGHPYHHLTIGSHEDLTAASLDDVKAFFREYYVPSNAVLTIVGDFETQEAKALVDAYFGAMPSGKRAKAPQASPPAVGVSRREFHALLAV